MKNQEWITLIAYIMALIKCVKDLIKDKAFFDKTFSILVLILIVICSFLFINDIMKIEIDFAEIQDITKLQEAIIIDQFKNIDIDNKTIKRYMKFKKNNFKDIEKLYPIVNEVEKLSDSIFKVNRHIILDRFSAKTELINNGYILKTKMSQKNNDSKWTTMSNVCITAKGIKLAKQFLYLKKHPKIIPLRPVGEFVIEITGDREIRKIKSIYDKRY